jgi:hypothetical protein
MPAIFLLYLDHILMDRVHLVTGRYLLFNTRFSKFSFVSWWSEFFCGYGMCSWILYTIVFKVCNYKYRSGTKGRRGRDKIVAGFISAYTISTLRVRSLLITRLSGVMPAIFLLYLDHILMDRVHLVTGRYLLFNTRFSKFKKIVNAGVLDFFY